MSWWWTNFNILNFLDCPAGHWGRECSKRCDCTNNSTCDQATGIEDPSNSLSECNLLIVDFVHFQAFVIVPKVSLVKNVKVNAHRIALVWIAQKYVAVKMEEAAITYPENVAVLQASQVRRLRTFYLLKNTTIHHLLRLYRAVVWRNMSRWKAWPRVWTGM